MANLPALPGGPGPLQRPTGQEIARRHTPAPPPVHDAAELTFSSGKTRDDAWYALREPVRAKLLERAGTVIDWWAWTDPVEEDSAAMVLGYRGLCLARPRLNTEHRRVYTVSTFVLDTASFRQVTIDHRPPPGAPGAAANASPAPPGTPVPDIGLSHAAKGVLGDLPAQAQGLLQEPFLAGQELLWHDWHYYGSPNRLTSFIFYLAGPRYVTFATGTQVVPAGHTTETAHWSLVCQRAAVVRRIGI